MNDIDIKRVITKILIYLSFIIIPFGILYLLKELNFISVGFFNQMLNIMISIYTGIGASYLFLRVYLFNKRPKIEISEFICTHIIDGEENYLFKFINKTGVDLYDVRIEASILTPFNDGDGQHLRGKPIKFARNQIDFIPAAKKSDVYNLHAIRIRTEDDIHTVWTNSESASYLRLTIIAKHSLSGFNQVFTKAFLDPKKVIKKDKSFKKGDCLEIE